jgi:hypothetical protein
MSHHFCDVLPQFTEELPHWEANMKLETTHLDQGKERHQVYIKLLQTVQVCHQTVKLQGPLNNFSLGKI